MDNLFINHKNKFIDKIRTIQSDSILGLIMSDSNLEIIDQRVFDRRVSFIAPNDNTETIEFYYILSGTVILSNKTESQILSTGDSFYTKGLKETIKFERSDDAHLLFITTTPVYNNIHSYSDNLLSLLNEIDKNDAYTYYHSVRVQRYAKAIAVRLNLTQIQINNIFTASLFHDLGKYIVPKDILNKQGELTNNEFELIKVHPLESSRLILDKFEKNVSQIAEQHHERIDGQGYPFGLSGNQICTEAKILSVADSYDAMTSDRPYRKAMSREYALNELIRLKNKQFDSYAVDAFVSLAEEGLV